MWIKYQICTMFHGIFCMALLASFCSSCVSMPSIQTLFSVDSRDGDLSKLLMAAEVLQDPAAMSASQVTPNDRTLCPVSETIPAPPNRVNTTKQLEALRDALNTTEGGPLDAFIVTNYDAHMGLAQHNQRVKYISGFSGSTMYAIVTTDKAAMWTDGRYYLQSDQQMDCNWIQMKRGKPGYPYGPEWLATVLKPGARVGATPTYMPMSTWSSFKTTLGAAGLNLVAVQEDMFDNIWTDNRPEQLNEPISVHDLKYAGESWQDKIKRLRKVLTKHEADAIVISALDETIWLFNLRGRDRPTRPFFDSYAIITQENVTLYLRNYTKLISSDAIQKHLQIDKDGICSGINPCITVKDIDRVLDDIGSLNDSKIWISPRSNQAIYLATGSRAYVEASPLQLMKAIKNPVQVKHIYQSQIRDSAVIAEFAALLEKEIPAGVYWSELSAAEKLSELRSHDELYWGPSFTPISGFGKHGAIIHYRPSNETDLQITQDGLYLIDTGGHYQDGTTDITRTFHFGKPTDEQKLAYTTVLVAAIELATTVWPKGLYGSDIDVRARAPLWAQGWHYNHGTGHGIGYFSHVHEGPGNINVGFSDSHSPIYEGMFFSDEPGHYVEGEYGIRLEIDVVVVEAEVHGYLKFDPATLVPFEPHLIDYNLLNEKQRKWLNAYHKRCEKNVGSYLNNHGKKDAYDWLLKRTEAIPEEAFWERATTFSPERWRTSNTVAATRPTSAALSVRSTHITVALFSAILLGL